MPSIEGKVQDYEGQGDAKTLADAHAIRKDKKKHANAMKHLKVMSKKSTHASHTLKHERAVAPQVQAAQNQGQTPQAQPQDTAGSEANAEGTPGYEEAEPMEQQ
jgi:hypothetical protein